jgi:hypothetical protein
MDKAHKVPDKDLVTSHLDLSSTQASLGPRMSIFRSVTALILKMVQ